MTLVISPHTRSRRTDLRRNRIAVSVMFAVAGAAFGTWTARIPSIKHNLGLSDGELSIALLALAAGGLVGMKCTGRIVDRHGALTVMAPAALTLGPALAATAYAPDLLTLILALVTFGVLHGTVNVSMNAHGAECQCAYQRPIMSSFHAWFSIGGFVGAGVGGLFAHADLSATATFLTIGAASTVLTMWALRWATARLAGDVDRREPQGDPARTALKSRTSRRALLLGMLAFGSLMCEGAAADWGSVYLHDSLGSSTGTAAAAFAVFSLMMTAGRLSGDRLVTRYGPAPLLRGCGLLAAAGFGAGILIGHPTAAIIGFGFLGAGLSCVVPQIYSAAANLDPAQAGKGLSQVAALGYLGFLTGPVLIGGATGPLGLANAMLILPVLTLIIAAAANTVRLKGNPAGQR